MTEILKLIERDGRLSAAQIAAMLGREQKEVEDVLAKCEEEKIILGYKALIDWDRVREDMVTAFIAVKISPQRGYGFDRIAERIYQYDEVESLYLMSGDLDLGVFMSGHSVKEDRLQVRSAPSTASSISSCGFPRRTSPRPTSSLIKTLEIIWLGFCIT